jgi:hypothetical protein
LKAKISPFGRNDIILLHRYRATLGKPQINLIFEDVWNFRELLGGGEHEGAKENIIAYWVKAG